MPAQYPGDHDSLIDGIPPEGCNGSDFLDWKFAWAFCVILVSSIYIGRGTLCAPAVVGKVGFEHSTEV